jgi:gas vesicle protein
VVNWFKWNTRSARPTNGAATSADNALLHALNGRSVQEPRKRAPQRIEAYVHLFRDKVKAVVDDALVEVPEAQRLHVRRVTVSRMLSQESEDVNQQVNEYIRQWKIDYQNEKSTAMDKASSTPAEFHAYVISDISEPLCSSSTSQRSKASASVLEDSLCSCCRSDRMDYLHCCWWTNPVRKWSTSYADVSHTLDAVLNDLIHLLYYLATTLVQSPRQEIHLSNHMLNTRDHSPCHFHDT